MNLLHFLGLKSKTIQPPINIPAARPECDISKTRVVAELLKIPREQRDDPWFKSFYENVATASFACGTPQTLVGPDGFTYFILRTPEEDRPFTSYCIRNMKDDFLLDRAWGVVFNPADDGAADWVFTHGNILNLHLTNQFVSVIDDRDIQNVEFTKTVGVIKKEEQVMIAQPSEEYLPRATRAALRSFLQYKGIKKPKVMVLTSQNDGKVIRKLAFNIPPENYPIASQLDHLMQQLCWFLPNNYILIPISKKSSLSKGLNEL